MLNYILKIYIYIGLSRKPFFNRKKKFHIAYFFKFTRMKIINSSNDSSLEIFNKNLIKKKNNILTFCIEYQNDRYKLYYLQSFLLEYTIRYLKKSYKLMIEEIKIFPLVSCTIRIQPAIQYKRQYYLELMIHDFTAWDRTLERINIRNKFCCTKCG